MECWHNILRPSSVRCCVAHREEQEDETQTEPLHKRPRINPSRERSSRGSRRWTRHVSTWIQRLKPNQPVTSRNERKLSALNYEFEIGSKIPLRYFDSNIFQYQTPIIKNDIFLLALYQRKAFLLPEFYPRSLHFIEEETVTKSASTKSRSSSDPNIFSLNSNYLTNDCDRKSLPGLVDYQFSRNLTSHSRLQSSREPFAPTNIEEPSKGVKQRIRERLAWLLNTSKTTVRASRGPHTETDESSTFLLPKHPPSKFQEPSQLPYSSASLALQIDPLKHGQREELIRTRTESYPSKPTKSDLRNLVIQSNDSIRYGYRSQTNLHREAASSEDSIGYYKLSNEKFSEEDSDSCILKEHNELVSCEEERANEVTEAPYARVDTNIHSKPWSESVDDESKNVVISTWKSFQDNFGSLTYKLRNRYSRRKSSLRTKEVDDSSLKDFGVESEKTGILPAPKKHPAFRKPFSKADESATNTTAQPSNSESSSVTYNFEFGSFLKLRKMSRRRSNNVGDECSGEPPSKHSRSNSLPEEPRRLYEDLSQPIKPQRKKYSRKHSQDLELSEDDFPSNIAANKIQDSRTVLQHSRREFLFKMVSTSSEEDEVESLRYDSRVFVESSSLNDDNINDVKTAFTNKEEGEAVVDSIGGNESTISESEALPDHKETTDYDTGTANNNNNNNDFNSIIPVGEIAQLELDAIDYAKAEARTIELSEANCDKLSSVIESFQEEKLPEISTYDVRVNVKDSVNLYICAKPSDVDQELEIIPNEGEDEQSEVHSNDKENISDNNLGNDSDSPAIESDGQPQIFVTLAEGSDEEFFEREKSKSENPFSFTDSIKEYHSEWSFPPVTTIILANKSNVDSLHESSTISSELEGQCPSVGETYNVSPNLSPGPRVTSPAPVSSDHHHQTAPKSPITVQEWVDSIPINTAERREEEPFEDDWRRGPLEIEERPKPVKERPANETLIRGESLLLGDEASALTVTSPCAFKGVKDESKTLPSPAALPRRKRSPLTLKDIHRSLSKDESESSSVPLHGGTPSKRSQFAETRDKQTSFQSETSILSGMSHQTVSSIESLLESRQLDPVDILINLGFGSSEKEEGISRIPARFLKPSKVPGNDINVFLKQEVNISDLADSSEWVAPNISTQASRRFPVKAVSPLVTNLIETVRESQQRLLQGAMTKSDISSSTASGDTKPPLSRFVNVAKELGKRASFARRMKTTQRRERLRSIGEGARKSVLLPENRLYLDLQGQRSPEAPKRRLIIGSNSFSLGNNGEIIDSDEEGESKSEEEEEEEEEEEGEEAGTRHRDSVTSVVSSVTSIDSKEEALREELHQLTLSVIKGRSSNASFSKPLPQNKRNRIMRSTNTSKWRNLADQSSSGNWEIAEEECYDFVTPPTIQEHYDTVGLVEEPLETNDFISAINSRRSICRQHKISETEELPIIHTNKQIGNKLQENDQETVDCKSAKLNMTGATFEPKCLASYVTTRVNRTSCSKKIGSAFRVYEGNSSLDSGRSMETVKHFPLKRSLALLVSDRETIGPQQGMPTILETKKLRRTSSLPDVITDPERNPFLSDNFPQSFQSQEDEFLRSTLVSLETSANAAMMAMMQMCKIQINLQSRLSKCSSTSRSAVTNCASNFEETKSNLHSEGDCQHFPGIPDTPDRVFDSPSEGTRTQMGEETLEVASQMRSTINSVIRHLEHYLTGVCPRVSSPDISNTVGQMLRLSQYQSQLCSDLERLSSTGSSHSSRTSTPQTASCLWTPTSPDYYHLEPEKLNAHYTSTSIGGSNPSSVHSVPPNYPNHLPLFRVAPTYSPFNLGASPILPQNFSLPRQKGGKAQPSPSESSSCEESFGGGDSGALGEWSDGKMSGISSPAYSSIQNTRMTDSIYPAVTSDMTELNRKMDKNSEEVSEIKEKLTMILQRLNSDSKS